MSALDVRASAAPAALPLSAAHRRILKSDEFRRVETETVFEGESSDESEAGDDDLRSQCPTMESLVPLLGLTKLHSGRARPEGSCASASRATGAHERSRISSPGTEQAAWAVSSGAELAPPLRRVHGKVARLRTAPATANQPAGAVDGALVGKPSRAHRGRSGRKHRRETGVASRALRLIDALPLGLWPPAAFSQLCNLLKDAPSPPIRLHATVSRLSSGALELSVQHEALRGGRMAFALHDVGSDVLRAEFLALLQRRQAGEAHGAAASAQGHLNLWSLEISI